MPIDIDVPPDTLRIFIYDHLLEHGRPPAAVEIGARFGISEASAKTAVASMRIGKTVLAHPVTGEIWMAGPFASGPTASRVVGQRTSWWANCAWDMLSVAAIVNEPVRTETHCPDCGELIPLHVSPTDGLSGSDADMVVHFLLPARQWYDDIGFT